MSPKVAEFWAEWGSMAYGGAAMWAFFEGETFVLLAAAAAHTTGVIDPWILMVSVWLGSFAGDQAWFALGRRYGTRVVGRFPGAQRRLQAAGGFVERYGDLFVLTFRFAYGIRNVGSAACAMAGMSHIRFAVVNFIAAGLWAATFVGAGWYLAAWLGVEGVAWLLGICGLVLVGGLVSRFLRQRRQAVAVQ
jgi:membrane protein DedA with SNARE-associated domain